MARYMAGQGLRRVAVVYSEDAYGRGLANLFEDAAAEYGMTVVDRLSHFGDEKQARQTVLKWEAFGYDSIFLSEALPSAAETIALLRRAGASVPIFGGDGLDGELLKDIPGGAGEGIVFASVFDPLNPDPAVQAFVAGFEERYGILPDAWAAQGYDALHLLAYALAQVDVVSPDAVAAIIRETVWKGVTGVYRFDETGELIGKPVLLKRLQDGEFVLLDH